MILVKLKHHTNRIINFKFAENSCEIVETCNKQYLSLCTKHKKEKSTTKHRGNVHGNGEKKTFLATSNAKSTIISVKRRNEILATKICA